jgi:glycogen operon protein
MFVAGDEFGRTQMGNNNAYCQDNELSWLDWRLAESNSGLLRFFKMLIALRKRHAIFRRPDFFPVGGSLRDSHEIHWQSQRVGEPDWSDDCRILGFMLDGQAVSELPDDDFFIILNSRLENVIVEIPPLPSGRHWCVLIDGAAESPGDIYPEEDAPVFTGNEFELPAMASLVLISKPERG